MCKIWVKQRRVNLGEGRNSRATTTAQQITRCVHWSKKNRTEVNSGHRWLKVTLGSFFSTGKWSNKSVFQCPEAFKRKKKKKPSSEKMNPGHIITVPCLHTCILLKVKERASHAWENQKFFQIKHLNEKIQGHLNQSVLHQPEVGGPAWVLSLMSLRQQRFSCSCSVTTWRLRPPGSAPPLPPHRGTSAFQTVACGSISRLIWENLILLVPADSRSSSFTGSAPHRLQPLHSPPLPWPYPVSLNLHIALSWALARPPVRREATEESEAGPASQTACKNSEHKDWQA